MQPPHRQQPHVLEAALTPATIALRVVEDIARYLFEAPADLREKVHVPAGSTQQGGLDEVMTQDRPPEGRAPREDGQSTVRGERRQPNDGIVPPVVRGIGCQKLCPVARIGL